MAGLQQYYFFPTDFFYPRPQPSTSNLDTAPAKLPPQTPNPKQEIVTNEDLQLQNHNQNQNQNQQQQPRSMIKAPPPTPALVYSPKKQSLNGIIDKKLSKLSTNPLSYLVCSEEEEDSDTF